MYFRRGCCIHCGIFVTDTLLGISDSEVKTTVAPGKSDKGNKGGSNDTTAPAATPQSSGELKCSRRQCLPCSRAEADSTAI